MLESCRYIVVEGVIGVGKTTLVHALSKRLDARTVLEVFEENPFLAMFYDNRERYAFSTEMFFLLSRFTQQETFAQEDLLRRYAVSDYLFEKCRLFASLTLGEAELGLFDKVYEILARQVPAPDLIIHLHAPIDVLMSRIAERGREYEKSIERDYLESLDQRYHQLSSRIDRKRLLAIDTTDVDFRHPEHVERLLALIDEGVRGSVGGEVFGG